MLLVIELGSDVMQNIVCNTKSIIFVTVITIPCKTIRKKNNDNKKQVMQKSLEFFYHLICNPCQNPSCKCDEASMQYDLDRNKVKILED